MHLTACKGPFCPDGSDGYVQSVLQSGLPPPLERDCGHWCTAFTYLDKHLPLVPYGFPGFFSSVGFFYRAAPEVWGGMQCASTSDSSSTTRACCTCNERRYCPFPNGRRFSRTDNGYCSGPCRNEDRRCMQLAAGCGVSVADAAQNWGAQRCSEQSIARGECDLCRHPMWCNDSSGFGFNGTIKSADDWWRAFGISDGGRFKGSRQCKWKPSQKQQFIETVRKRAIERQLWAGPYPWVENPQPGLWNEVNMYVGPSDEMPALMWRNLVGLGFIRGGDTEHPTSIGTKLDRTHLQKIRDHWRRLGTEVPIIELSMEHWARVDHWDKGSFVNLSHQPYNIAYMDTPMG